MKNSTIIRTTVDRDLYLKADAQAKAQDTNLSAVLRELLTDWVDDPHNTGPQEGEGAQAKWLRLSQWEKAKKYERPAHITSKADLMEWAKSRGFKG